MDVVDLVNVDMVEVVFDVVVFALVVVAVAFVVVFIRVVVVVVVVASGLWLLFILLKSRYLGVLHQLRMQFYMQFGPSPIGSVCNTQWKCIRDLTPLIPLY